jgi:lysine-specific demethylase/histidyl-hydroxylase NO66
MATLPQSVGASSAVFKRLMNFILVFVTNFAGNFSQSEIGQPFLDVVLEAGDFLYFPRGVVHQVCCSSVLWFVIFQAVSLPEAHSLHVTVSTYQKNSWADFFELVAFPLSIS